MNISRWSVIAFVMIGLCCFPEFVASKSRGTHFLVEPFSGLVFSEGLELENAIGFESGCLLGVGGKFKAFPPRFYLYVKASQTNFGSDEVFMPERQTVGVVERSYGRWIGGLRVVLPLYNRLRLNLEMGAGEMYSKNRYLESGRSVVGYRETQTVAEFGIGINLRLYRWMSVGFMYDYLFVAEDEYGDMIAVILDERSHGTDVSFSHLTATLGIHF